MVGAGGPSLGLRCRYYLSLGSLPKTGLIWLLSKRTLKDRAGQVKQGRAVNDEGCPA